MSASIISRGKIDLQGLRRFADWEALYQGKSLYDSGKARITFFDMQTAICHVAEREDSLCRNQSRWQRPGVCLSLSACRLISFLPSHCGLGLCSA